MFGVRSRWLFGRRSGTIGVRAPSGPADPDGESTHATPSRAKNRSIAGPMPWPRVPTMIITASFFSATEQIRTDRIHRGSRCRSTAANIHRVRREPVRAARPGCAGPARPSRRRPDPPDSHARVTACTTSRRAPRCCARSPATRSASWLAGVRLWPTTSEIMVAHRWKVGDRTPGTPTGPGAGCTPMRAETMPT